MVHAPLSHSAKHVKACSWRGRDLDQEREHTQGSYTQTVILSVALPLMDLSYRRIHPLYNRTVLFYSVDIGPKAKSIRPLQLGLYYAWKQRMPDSFEDVRFLYTPVHYSRSRGSPLNNKQVVLILRIPCALRIVFRAANGENAVETTMDSLAQHRHDSSSSSSVSTAALAITSSSLYMFKYISCFSMQVVSKYFLE